MSGALPTRSALTTLSQMVVTTAIVATLAYLPACVLIALALRAFGVSFQAWLTLGASLHPVLGLLAWWLLIFVGAAVYVFWMFPREDPVVRVHDRK